MLFRSTKGNPRVTDVAIPGGHRMSVHVIRRVEGEPECLRARPVVVPIARVLEDAGMPVPGAVTVTDVRAERFDGLVPVLVVDGAEKIVVAVPETDDAWLMGSDMSEVMMMSFSHLRGWISLQVNVSLQE